MTAVKFVYSKVPKKNMTATPDFYPSLSGTIKHLTATFDRIPAERRKMLDEIAAFVKEKSATGQKIELVFICTHNSRRSHISQIWAQAAASWYGVRNVVSYSGGTEATAFNPRAVQAMEKAGFRIEKDKNADNPIYQVHFSPVANPVIAFSKRYDSEANPKNNFAAIMTCSHADENCPIVFGMEKRISLPYNDPKDFDGTSRETEMYLERVMEIGREILFAFSLTK